MEMEWSGNSVVKLLKNAGKEGEKEENEWKEGTEKYIRKHEGPQVFIFLPCLWIVSFYLSFVCSLACLFVCLDCLILLESLGP